jgi:DNA-binding CsgD family transcriptional regulator
MKHSARLRSDRGAARKPLPFRRVRLSCCRARRLPIPSALWAVRERRRRSTSADRSKRCFNQAGHPEATEGGPHEESPDFFACRSEFRLQSLTRARRRFSRSTEAWTQIGRSLGLSGRELQIVRGTFDDKTELEIAADLHISPSTIHTHVERLHHKLVITDRAQLLLRVTQEFLALTATPGHDLPPICSDRGTRRCPLRP